MTSSAVLFVVFRSLRVKGKRFQRMLVRFLMEFVEQLAVYILGDNLIEIRWRVSTIQIIRQRSAYYEFIFCSHVRRPRRRNVGFRNRIKSFLTPGAPANHHRLWLSDNLKTRRRIRLTAKCIPQLSGFKYTDYSRLVVNCKFRQVPKVIVGLWCSHMHIHISLLIQHSRNSLSKEKAQHRCTPCGL